MTLPHHQFANLFPMIEGGAFAELVNSIRTNGLRDPIIVHEGAVLDGRNRQRACIEAGVDCVYEPLPDGEDALAFVIDKNLKRRHLDESQRAMVAAKLATMKSGTRTDLRPIGLRFETVSQPDAAKHLNVSERSVRRATVVRNRGVQELQEAVERGKLPVSVAAQAARLDPDKQRRIAAEAEAGRGQGAVKSEMRAEKEGALAEKIMSASTSLGVGRYGVIYADPPWRFEPYSRQTGMDRAADNHYPTMTLEDIAALDVPAADDCVLFLWATAPMLPEALLVMERWGFEYKSQIVWVKDRLGTGYWARNKHEILLIGTKGSVPAPEMGTQPESAIVATVGRHSEKPALFAEIIERLFPTIPKFEMFCRTPREGWTCWGAEAAA